MPSRPLQVLHTSDCHLDGDFPYRNDRHLTSKYFASFRRVIDKTLELNADILVIAGDFFDSNRASQVSTDFALSELARTRSQVIIGPGNHDSLDEGSVYQRVDFRQAGDHVHVLSETCGLEIVLPELQTRLWGRGGTEMDPTYRPLAGLPSREGDLWHIAVAHGHFMTDAAWDDRWAPISEEELAGGAWDYLALGHWDHFVDVTQGTMRAVYSGSAVPSRDAEYGTCAQITFTPGETPVVRTLELTEQRRIG
jgi:DNA repair exonuclease SbcCD nuclease subunit